MIVTTLSNYPGYKIVEHLGLVFAYDDIPRFTRFVMDMDKCIENAEKCLAKKAKEKGEMRSLVFLCHYQQIINRCYLELQ